MVYTFSNTLFIYCRPHRNSHKELFIFQIDDHLSTQLLNTNGYPSRRSNFNAKTNFLRLIYIFTEINNVAIMSFSWCYRFTPIIYIYFRTDSTTWVVEKKGVTLCPIHISDNIRHCWPEDIRTLINYHACTCSFIHKC